ncbi:hypothetical protein DMENIID0001_153400 [Sergentomyia squamirostris]
MKVLLSLCLLICVVYSLPVAKEEKKEAPVKFAPVEKAEDHAGEEDLEPAEAFGFGYGSFDRSGGWGGGWGGGSYEGRGWGGGWGGGYGGWGGGWGGGWSGSNEFWG